MVANKKLFKGQSCYKCLVVFKQGLHRLEKYLNIQDCLENSLKIKFVLNFVIYRRIQQCFWKPKSVYAAPNKDTTILY